MSEREDDIAWIEARERGVVSDHPRAALYARLGAAIAALPDLGGGGDGWRTAVLADLDGGAGGLADADELRRARAARVRRRGLAAAIVTALAAAAIVFFVVRPRPPRAVEARLAYTVAAPDGVRRAGGTVAIGQEITFTADLPGPGEIWIYRGERLVLRCPGAATGCAARAIPGGTTLTATFRTDAAVPYTALLVTGHPAAPTGALSADADAAGRAIRETRTFDVH